MTEEFDDTAMHNTDELSDDEPILDMCFAEHDDSDVEDTMDESEGGSMAMGGIQEGKGDGKSDPMATSRRLGSSENRGLMWSVGQVLRVRFLEGSYQTQRKVKEFAKEWENYANVTFQFVDHDPSDIRIAFNPKKGWNSKVGTIALKVWPGDPTMNLAVTSRTSDRMLRRHVLHEFGHALGCRHEHQSPSARIPWDHDAVLEKMRERGWSDEKTWSNILNRAIVSRYSRFDGQSIMLYSVDGALTTNGVSYPHNMDLSRGDKDFIGRMYPFNGARVESPSIIRQRNLKPARRPIRLENVRILI